MRRETNAVEHGDRSMAAGQIGRYLDDLDRLNRWFRGYTLSLRAVNELVEPVERRRPVVVADVGGARGDLAVRLVRDARARARPVAVVVLDRDEASLVMGARAAKPYPEIRWVQADAAALPLRAGAVDVAVSALTVHHLEPEDAVRALAGMRSAARLGVVVNDLIRSRLILALVWLTTRLFARHPSSRHDGPLSVRRAYDGRELRALAGRAGFRRFAVRAYWPFARLIGVGT